MILRENTKEKIANSADVAKILQTILGAEHQTDRDKEHFWIIGLNNANRILYIELATLGILNETTIAPREVFRLAVMKACANIIIGHNHPSGELKPSASDIITTGNLKEAGKIIGIQLLDHIIIAGENHYSFNDDGKM